MVAGSIGGSDLDGITGSRIDGGAVNASNDGNDINLRQAEISSSGTFSGSAGFTGATRQNGSWEGGFFGPTTEVDGGVEGHLAPSHVAGVSWISLLK